MSTKGSKKQPARISDRLVHMDLGEFETIDFAKRRAKNRRRRDLAKASRKKNR